MITVFCPYCCYNVFFPSQRDYMIIIKQNKMTGFCTGIGTVWLKMLYLSGLLRRLSMTSPRNPIDNLSHRDYRAVETNGVKTIRMPLGMRPENGCLPTECRNWENGIFLPSEPFLTECYYCHLSVCLKNEVFIRNLAMTAMYIATASPYHFSKTKSKMTLFPVIASLRSNPEIADNKRFTNYVIVRIHYNNQTEQNDRVY